MPRGLFTAACAVGAAAVLGGCGQVDHTPGTSAPTVGGASAARSASKAAGSPSARRADVSKIDVCKLATTDEAAGPLAAPVTDFAVQYPLDGVGCQYDIASNAVFLLIQLEGDPDLYFDRNPEGGRPVAGLRDAAFTYPGHPGCG